MCNRKYSILWGFQHDALLIFANHVDNWYRHLRHRNSSVRIKKGFSYTPWLICFWVRKRLVLNLYVRRTNIVNMLVVQSFIDIDFCLFQKSSIIYLNCVDQKSCNMIQCIIFTQDFPFRFGINF